ncbi:hypothetical protein Tco_0139210, partial [Tanacetum coccineum]
MPGPLVISVLNAKKQAILLTNVERKLLMSQNEVNYTKKESENEECFIRPEHVVDEEEDDQQEAYSYVVHRLMLTTPKQSEDTQRHNIFRTRCRINQDALNELLNGYNRKNGSKRCAMKIDIPKAYDTINWDFLKEVM